MAALSLLACVPIETIEQLMDESDCCGLVVACRASRLDCQTAKALIESRRGAPKLSQAQVEQSKQFFDSLSLSIAQRAIRYGSVRDVALKAGRIDDAFARPGPR